MNSIEQKAARRSFAEERKQLLAQLQQVGSDYMNGKKKSAIAQSLLQASKSVEDWARPTKNNELIGVCWPEKCAFLSGVIRDVAGLIGGDAKVPHAFVLSMIDRMTRQILEVTWSDIATRDGLPGSEEEIKAKYRKSAPAWTIPAWACELTALKDSDSDIKRK